LLAASAVFAWVRPWSGVPFALFLAFTYGLPHLVRIGTPARGQSFRRIKWILLAAAGVSLSVETLWAPQILKTTTAESFYTVEGMIGMEIVILYPILWFETYREGLRRKLPIEQWPERLYR
jgi:hypothetical protein